MSVHLLPDSRMNDPVDCVMADWPLGDGRSVRTECIPIYCGSCGAKYGYVPRDNTSFVFWLCVQCYEQYGDVANTYAVPEDEFNAKVQHEMERKFGRCLTELEIFQRAEQGELGRELELLEKESPYPVPAHPV